MWLLLDLNFCSRVYGGISIILGLILCVLNYQSPDKKYRKQAQFIVSFLWATCLLSFCLFQTRYPEIYTIWLGVTFAAGGLGIAILLYLLIQSGTTFVFTVVLGTFTGFTLANILDVTFYYRYLD